MVLSALGRGVEVLWAQGQALGHGGWRTEKAPKEVTSVLSPEGKGELGKEQVERVLDSRKWRLGAEGRAFLKNSGGWGGQHGCVRPRPPWLTWVNLCCHTQRHILFCRFHLACASYSLPVKSLKSLPCGSGTSGVFGIFIPVWGQIIENDYNSIFSLLSSYCVSNRTLNTKLCSRG